MHPKALDEMLLGIIAQTAYVLGDGAINQGLRLPLFHELTTDYAHTIVLISHAFPVHNQVFAHLNPGNAPDPSTGAQMIYYPSVPMVFNQVLKQIHEGGGGRRLLHPH